MSNRWELKQQLFDFGNITFDENKHIWSLLTASNSMFLILNLSLWLATMGRRDSIATFSPDKLTVEKSRQNKQIISTLSYCPKQIVISQLFMNGVYETFNQTLFKEPSDNVKEHDFFFTLQSRLWAIFVFKGRNTKPK